MYKNIMPWVSIQYVKWDLKTLNSPARGAHDAAFNAIYLSWITDFPASQAMSKITIYHSQHLGTIHAL